MHEITRLAARAVVLLIVTTLLAACARDQGDSSAAAAPEYMPSSTIKDLMQFVIDPSADAVWLSVTTVISAGGTVETEPKTDEDWARVRSGAVTLIEAANLLMMPGRRVARPGEKSEAPGVELEPDQMQVLIEKDRPGWNARAKALHEAGVAVLKAIDAKDPQKVFDLGEQIEVACESCHQNYWYPNDRIPSSLP